MNIHIQKEITVSMNKDEASHILKESVVHHMKSLGYIKNDGSQVDVIVKYNFDCSQILDLIDVEIKLKENSK